MQRVILLAGYTLHTGRLRSALFRCKICHFNWFENVAGSPQLLRLGLVKFSALIRKLRYLKKRTPERELLVKWFLKNSQTIVIHSRETIDFLKTSYPQTDLAKVKYVPHPHFIDAHSAE